MPHVNLRSTIACSFILHLILFSLMAGIKVKENAIKLPYIQVEMVQLSQDVQKAYLPAGSATTPQKINHPLPELKPLPSVNTPRQQPKETKPSPLHELKAEQPPAKASPSAANIDNHSAPEVSPATSKPGKEAHQPVGIISPVQTRSDPHASRGKPPTASKLDKGAYQPFYRLSKLPAFKYRVAPAYPQSERNAGVETRVLVEIFINEQGGVDDVTIRKSGGHLFDQAVLEAVRASSFAPGYAGTQPVPAILQIPYVFKLR